MKSIIGVILIWASIAYLIFYGRFDKKRDIKDAVGRAITSSIMCLASIINISVYADYGTNVIVMFLSIMSFGWAIYDIVRCKNK